MTTPHSVPALGTHPAAGPNPGRAETRDQLSRATYDLLVIGGGILGISTAWHAAQSGLRVALVDAGDFAGATSSASSKLLHGGLRYLQTGAVKLVAENHFERRAVSKQVAPHLARPLTFYLPVYKGGPHGAAKLGAGVFAYSALSAFGDGVGHVISPERARRDVPELRTDGLRAVAVYGDDQMNDARMALMTVRAAVDAGTEVLNHAEVTGLRFTRGRVTGAELRDRLDSTEFGIDARLVLNATGPWTDHLRAMEDKAAAPSVRLSKGAHLVLRRTSPWKAALATPIDKYRITFALPWEDMLLLGTTDEEYEGDPREVSVTDSDVTQILDEAAFSVRDQQLSRDLITYSFAGLRVLPGGPGDTSKAKRETVVSEGPGGMLSVAGGKWTTFRHIGRTVIDKLSKLPGRPLTEDMEPMRSLPRMPLPGIANPQAVAHRLLVDGPAPGPRMAPDTARHLATHYGSLAFDIARLANEDPSLAERIHPDAPEIRAQIVYARDREWAETAEDVLRRRTTLTVRGLDTAEVRDDVAKLLADRPS
ncbi:MULTISPECIES: glycerol-3-phosphate dehydrogenase/oxidase [Streptomyces]|uniref:Glycerol-3-phosphate dehydrogenase n=1 Tax=Streptomyces albidoflavus TaxID=1886 RepID=A0AA37FEB4_9ACTN|nr:MULTISPECIES: glycerol-3-phosphate dehydrogenase/oxidase [Streptomyces]MBV7253400.1 glycerol-3-phosphate dehydrogenase/oxidase [Streptomyces sp. S-2]RZE49968.1 glycerol-3-phosphate dehydrogenase/oxidase [Streptomyces albidoflavus]WQG74613.1 glycerol-3-phosphate dehydrogenase/oxidase [Streptomyces albidoflavus]GHI49341.1 glycerol-3-phosphate dehydrogenase [Streptomyces albidoflavus]